MDLKQLEYFVAIAEAGTFSRAAQRHGVGQPVLSRQIKALEDELGAELYHRTGRGIVLSEAPAGCSSNTRAACSNPPPAQRALFTRSHRPRPAAS